MKKYQLKFISDENLKQHVTETIRKYRSGINLRAFKKNLLDPLKLTFDSKIYSKPIEELIENEALRQIDKTNTNVIGYFNQNIFNYIGGEKWIVPTRGFDVVNQEQSIYVEMKNKHNTMNSSSSQKTYMRMQHQVLQNPKAVCLLVEVIAKRSQDKPWTISLDGKRIVSEKIRKVSMDKFYELVTGDPESFKKLIEVIPRVIDDVLLEEGRSLFTNQVFAELYKISPDIMKSIFIFSFGTYQGFEHFEIDKS